MSDSYGVVRFKSDGKQMFYRYNGTSDICNPCLYDNSNDIWTHNEWEECTCNHDEPVEIYSDYGGGFYWQGRACRYCNAITEGLEPWPSDEKEYIDITDGQPEWWKS
jgi:hypothetical protein